MKTDKITDWTHKEVEITDIRKTNEFYIFTLTSKYAEVINGIDVWGVPLMVKKTIFDERLRSYFMKDPFRVTREEILSVKWNMYITKGYYIKLSNSLEHRHDMNESKFYVSFLEIDGLLGTFKSILRDKDIK